jgi:hypothetical protein
VVVRVTTMIGYLKVTGAFLFFANVNAANVALLNRSIVVVAVMVRMMGGFRGQIEARYGLQHCVASDTGL